MSLATDLQLFLTHVLTPAEAALIKITTALESNSQLSDIAARLISGGASAAASLFSLDGKITACNTGAVAGAVTANAGTNLNTSLLATETSLSSLNGKVTACNTGAVAGAVTANAGTNLNTSALALESGGNIAAIKAKTDNLPTDPAKESGKLTTLANMEGGFWTAVQVHGGGGVYDVTTAAAGGVGSDYWDIVSGGVYLLRCDPDWTGGAADSDIVRGVFKLGGATTGGDDGWYIRNGEQYRIGPLAAGSTVYVRAHSISVAGRWKLYRKDA